MEFVLNTSKRDKVFAGLVEYVEQFSEEDFNLYAEALLQMGLQICDRLVYSVLKQHLCQFSKCEDYRKSPNHFTLWILNRLQRN